jgi:predicted transcriptional regulator
VRTPRVGLSLKPATPKTLHQFFLAKPYRLTTNPTLKKGRVHTIIGMHAAGSTVAAIAAASGSTAASVKKYVEQYEAARKSTKEISAFFGKVLSPAELCEAAGILARAV